MRQSAGRAYHVQLALGWCSWLTVLALQELPRPVVGALLRCRAPHLFQRWRVSARQLASCITCMIRNLLLTARRKLLWGLVSWRGSARLSRARRQRASSSARRAFRRKMARCFESWMRMSSRKAAFSATRRSYLAQASVALARRHRYRCWRRWISLSKVYAIAPRHKSILSIRRPRQAAMAMRTWRLHVHVWLRARAWLKQERQARREAENRLEGAEASKLAADEALKLCLQRLRLADVDKAEQAAALDRAVAEAGRWLASAQEGWQWARRDLERRHAVELIEARLMVEGFPGHSGPSFGDATTHGFSGHSGPSFGDTTTHAGHPAQQGTPPPPTPPPPTPQTRTTPARSRA